VIPNAAGWDEAKARYPDLLPDFDGTPVGQTMRELYDDGMIELTGSVHNVPPAGRARCFGLTVKGQTDVKQYRRSTASHIGQSGFALGQITLGTGQ
jgi:hypothetical protein